MFLATYDGKLEPGYVPTTERTANPGWKARMRQVGNQTYYDWPAPWALRCDTCGRDFPYGVVMGKLDRAELRPPQVRIVAESVDHICAYCEGYSEQINLFGAA